MDTRRERGRERGMKRDNITEGISYYKTADITDSSTATSSDLVLLEPFHLEKLSPTIIIIIIIMKKLVGSLLISSSVIVSFLSLVSCHHALCALTSVMMSVEAAEPCSAHGANSGH